MTPLAYLKIITQTLPEIARKTGHSTARLYLSFIRLYVCYHVQIEEFQASHMYDFSNQKMSEILTERRRAKQARIFNADAVPADYALFNEKHRFNAFFSDFVRRDWLYMPEASPEAAADFAESHPVFLAKANNSTQGKNIHLFRRGEFDPEEFARSYAGQDYLLECFVTQHPDLTALNPTSVNTVRIVSARMGDRVLLVGACLRCGGSGSYVDNFHQGGVAYPIDLETGVVNGPGRTLEGRAEYIRHPSTGCVMPGFSIPHWDRLRTETEQAALLSPHIGYIGWDIAITPDGVDFIEGNVNSPDPIVIQLDDRGVYPSLKRFIAESRRTGSGRS